MRPEIAIPEGGGVNGTQTFAQRDDFVRPRVDSGALLHGHEIGRHSLQPAARELRHPRQSKVVVPLSREDRRLRGAHSRLRRDQEQIRHLLRRGDGSAGDR